MEPVLTLEGVRFGYGQTPVLENISFCLGPGEMLGIIGPNGSGKSTLLQLMDGILKPNQGNIRVGERLLSSLGRASLARLIAMVGQEYHFRFTFSAVEVVLMGRFPYLRNFQFEGKRDLAIAFDAMEATHCVELADRPIQDLSGGERQRVLIARALAQEPSIILLDEPTSFLDLRFKREIFQLVQRLSAEQGMGIVIVSHDINLAAQYCRRIIMLQKGSIYADGQPDRVLTAANIEAVYECPVLVDKNPVTGSPRVNLL